MLKKILPLFLFLLASLTACMDDEEYIVSPTAAVTFSTDSVCLDTVLAGEASSTYTFEIYNHNAKAIRLSSVRLESGADSPFRINVDGRALTDGTGADFSISGNDSIRVFLFVKAPDSDSDAPVHVTDHLLFETEGGNQQSVTLEAWAQSVIQLSGYHVTGNETFSAKRPYQIMDSLVVDEGATLNVSAGVRFYLHKQAEVIVRGTLHVNGTATENVLFRGDRLGNMFTAQPYDRIPGQWGGITFKGSSYGNTLSFADIHSGNYGVRCDSSDVTKVKLDMEGCILHNMEGDCLNARSSNIYVSNTQITNAAGNCVTIRGGQSSFVHCTIANFYVFTGGRGIAMDFANFDGTSRLPMDLLQCYNCIITGYSEDEILGSQSEENADDAFNYYFRNCLLNTPAPTDSLTLTHFPGCIWDVSDNEVCRENNFSPAFDLDALTFSFQPDSLSRAIDAGDVETARLYAPTDRLGRSRLTDEGPDIGCYERIKP